MENSDKKEKILIIEDDADFRFMLCKSLEKKGYFTQGAGDYNEALTKVNDCFYEMVISDIRLPSIDGIDTVMKIKEKQSPKDMVIIIMTGFSEREPLIKAIKLGVNDYISKPFTIEEFNQIVDKNMKHYHLQKEKELYVKKIDKYNSLLTNKNEYMNALLSSLAEAFFTVNNDLEITEFNEMAEIITGYTKKEALGQKCALFLKSKLCHLKCPIKTAMGNDSPALEVETTITRKDGSIIPILLSASSIKDSNLNIIGGVEVIRDISEFKRMTREIEEAKEKIQQWGNELDKKVKERTKELLLIYNVGKEISTTLKLQEVLDKITDKICDVLQIKICSILLLDEEKQYLTIASSRGLSEDIVKATKIKRGEQVSGWVVENNKSIFEVDITNDDRFVQKQQEKYYSDSFISVPLSVKNEVMGVINVNNKISKESFNKNDFNLINGIAQQASIVIENAKLYSSLEKTYLNVVMSLMTAVDVKDHYTNWHSHQVTLFGEALAKELGLEEEKINIIKKACLLHDIGKIAVHDNILTKKGFLTEEEREEIEKHPLKSAEILKPLGFLDEVGAIIKQHHERYDGKGYPLGLKGDDISIGGRLMAVVDSFSAMISTRPYRKIHLTIEQAVEELLKNKGTQFDPNVVDAFLRVLEKDPNIVLKVF